MFLNTERMGLHNTWRYVLGFFIVIFAWQILGGFPLLGFVGYLKMKGESVSSDIISSGIVAGISRNVLLIILLSSFVFGLLGLFFVNKFLHQQRFMRLLTARKRFSWRRVIFSFGLAVLFGFIMFAISYYYSPEDFVYSFDASKFFTLVIVALLLLPIQIGFEELFFRGYIMQGIAMATKSRLLAFLLPALFFGLLHGLNPEVIKNGFWLMMLYYIGTGLFLGAIVIMDDGLELTLGYHFANNLMAVLFFRIEESALPSDAMFVVKNYNPVEEIAPFFIMMFVYILVFAVVFKWKNWNKLYTNKIV